MTQRIRRNPYGAFLIAAWAFVALMAVGEQTELGKLLDPDSYGASAAIISDR